MRLFIGIPLADNAVGELSALVSRLRSGERGTEPGVSGLRWVAPESWHITLQFLGSSTLEQLQCLGGRLGEVRNATVPVELGELGCFERAGVFFADIVVSPALANLQQRVVSATSACGFVAETRPFHPHITLARKVGNKLPPRANIARRGLRSAAREQESENPRSGAHSLRDLIAKAGTYRFSRFTAHEFLLYESHLGSEGSRYEIRGRFPLPGRET